MPVPIRTVDELMQRAANGVNTFIRLNYGVRSSKYVEFDGTRFYIFNEVDGTEQRLLPNDLEQDGLLLEAIKTGNFFVD